MNKTNIIIFSIILSITIILIILFTLGTVYYFYWGTPNLNNIDTFNVPINRIRMFKSIKHIYNGFPFIYPNIKPGENILVPHYRIKDFILGINLIKHPFNLYIVDHPYHSSDLSVNLPINIINNPKILHIYAEDWNGPKHPKVTILPIGIPTNNMNIEDKLLSIYKPLHKKPNKILANFHFNIINKPISGNKPQRQECYDALIKNPLVDFWTERRKKIDTWESHNNYSFELCPEGNGLDTHRFYEALILNTIPIVKSGKLNDLYKKFPCIIINNWNEITPENIIKWKKLYPTINKEKLMINYWT